jgi:hypothetical protein
MAVDMGNEEMATRFRACLDEEQEHLTKVRSWYALLTADTGELM